MNNLEKIQKTMKVFQTLTKIVMGFSFVAIAFIIENKQAISGWQRKFDGR